MTIYVNNITTIKNDIKYCVYNNGAEKHPPKHHISCANCGNAGHIYKNCNHPVTSFGVICYRLAYDHTNSYVFLEYLMVQRKDSFCYVEFLRGKYTLDNKNYLLKMFLDMTQDEIDKIQTNTFDTLWKNLWQIKECTNYLKEYNEAKLKFNTLKGGYFIRNKENNNSLYFNLDYIVLQTVTTHCDTEWGFPKGRRNINEPDLNCAMREFSEETGLKSKHITVIKDIKPLEEVFSGSNKTRYKHVYYVAEINMDKNVHCEKLLFDPSNKMQNREIRNVKWFSYNDVQNRIRSENIERKELFKRVNQLLCKNICVYNKFNESK